MSAIKFSKLPMSKKDFEEHFKEKIENAKWLGHLYEYSQSGKSEKVQKPKTLKKPERITEPFKSFPYWWGVQKSKVQIETLKVVVEDHTQFDEDEINYIASVPFHNASIEAIERIVSSIEDQSFDKTKKASHSLAQKRVAVVIGLNNCNSFNPEQTDKFKGQIEVLRKAKLANYVSLTIIPFFWGYPWISKNKKELGFSLISSRIFTIHGCYRIANSYFKFFRGTEKNLWISEEFNKKGNPSEKAIPYQSIRNKILYSTSLRKYFESSESESKYILSLDGDFVSLKATGSSIGLLTHYDELIQEYHKEAEEYPDVVSTGYTPPENEKNELIKLGVELDRLIRAAIPGKFVYMPEPNFVFRVTDIDDLKPGRLSWLSKEPSMGTESRRLISNGLTQKIFDSEHFIYSNQGGVQTEIDSTWRTTTVNKYKKVPPSYLKQKGVQKAIRGLHQSYADPQVWATNVYKGLQVTISGYIKNAIAPMKGIRELFDPITIRNDRYGADQTHSSDFETLAKVFPIYIEFMKKSISQKNLTKLVEEFIEKASISGKTHREGWAIFMKSQLNKFKEYRDLLKENYKNDQIEEVIEAAISTGKVIKDFYEERVMASEE